MSPGTSSLAALAKVLGLAISALSETCLFSFAALNCVFCSSCNTLFRRNRRSYDYKLVWLCVRSGRKFSLALVPTPRPSSPSADGGTPARPAAAPAGPRELILFSCSSARILASDAELSTVKDGLKTFGVVSLSDFSRVGMSGMFLNHEAN